MLACKAQTLKITCHKANNLNRAHGKIMKSRDYLRFKIYIKKKHSIQDAGSWIYMKILIFFFFNAKFGPTPSWALWCDGWPHWPTGRLFFLSLWHCSTLFPNFYNLDYKLVAKKYSKAKLNIIILTIPTKETVVSDFNIARAG